MRFKRSCWRILSAAWGPAISALQYKMCLHFFPFFHLCGSRATFVSISSGTPHANLVSILPGSRLPQPRAAVFIYLSLSHTHTVWCKTFETSAQVFMTCKYPKGICPHSLHCKGQCCSELSWECTKSKCKIETERNKWKISKNCSFTTRSTQTAILRQGSWCRKIPTPPKHFIKS